MEEININIKDDAKEIGLAELIASLIRENCLHNRKKARIFSRLLGMVKITATDADVSIILEFNKGNLTIKDGTNIPVPFEVIASSENIINLSNIRLFLSYPILISREGIETIKAALNGKIAIKRILTNIPFGINLLRIISIN